MGCSNSTDAQPIPGKIHKPPQNDASSGVGANNYFSDVPAYGADELPP